MTRNPHATTATPGPDAIARDPQLAEIIAARAPRSQDYPTPIPNLGLFRRDGIAPPAVCMVEPSIVVVIQGAKEMLIGGDRYPYDVSRFLITSITVPANSAVTVASADAPCLGLSMKLDLRILAELIAQGGLPTSKKSAALGSAGIGTLSPALMDPLGRLLRLLDEPETIPVLAPLIQREIHFRLLMSDQAPLLRQITSVDSQGHRIAKAIDWLKLNYAAPLRIDDLAARVQMSAPTFHHHFRHLTSMSPLQYQKWLRLNEAKRLMLNEHLDAASAAFRVGYESPSQFSREYGRLFGVPPKRDIIELKKRAAGA